MRRLCAALLATGAVAAPHAQATPSLDDLLVHAGAYVRGLEQQMSRIISDEVYEQRAVEQTVLFHRSVHAEMLFWWLDEERVWLSVRNAVVVDRRRVPDSENRLERALSFPAETTPEDVTVSRSLRLRGLQEESARWDIGRIARTTSNPTEVLQYLAAENQSHWAFSRDREERANGTNAWKVVFREQRAPAVLQFEGRDVETSGAVWLRPDDGVVVRTQRSAVISSHLTETVTVDFQRDAKLRLWLPKHMTENYGNVRCWSDFSHYRRFETSGRVLPPK